MRPRFKRFGRRAAIAVWAAVLLVVLLGMIAFGIDTGYIALARTQLQSTADAAALAAAAKMSQPWADMFAEAQAYASYQFAAGQAPVLNPSDVEYGTWNAMTRTFTPTTGPGNAVRVTARRANVPLFFGGILGKSHADVEASAVAMAMPRDIAFVVDLSGSMNDDTESVWATKAINSKFAPDGYPTIGTQLMQDLYDDFGYGTYPNITQYIGEPLGIGETQQAYVIMTADGGPLSQGSIPAMYRISSSDSELVRKVKAYSWMIDYQIAVVMPGVKPTADSLVNYTYWEKYLDYIIYSVDGGSPPDPGGGGPWTPPPPPPVGSLPSRQSTDWFAAWQDSKWGRGDRSDEVATIRDDRAFAMAGGGWQALFATQATVGTTYRGWLPPAQDPDRLIDYNNPNLQTFPSASPSLPEEWWNRIGYATYTSFMVDNGRDLKPDDLSYTPISVNSPHCPFHAETTAGGMFSFPPRTQPMHAARRALIAAIHVVKDRNSSIPSTQNRDWVSVISFDKAENGGARVVQTLTEDYSAAMVACTMLQAVGDQDASTATEAGMIVAADHLSPTGPSGAGRPHTNKVIVLLTDGVPNVVTSTTGQIDAYIAANSNPDWYGGGAYAYDAPLMQTKEAFVLGWSVFPVGLGLGTDYDFMDRLARTGGTADNTGMSVRGTGNPAEYEQRLVDIFTEIIKTPRVRLVE